METLQLMENRYSVRNFTDQAVEEEKIAKILRAGQVAPTAHNNQPQKILVVKSKEGLARWQKCTRCRFNEQLLMIICYDKNQSWKREYDGQDSGFVDASIVTTQMMLEAADLGIGSTWVMWFDPAAVREEFNLPENIVPVSALPMGYASEKGVPSPSHTNRKNLEETIVCETF